MVSPAAALGKRAMPKTSVTARAARPMISPWTMPATRSAPNTVSDLHDVAPVELAVLDEEDAEIGRDVAEFVEVEDGGGAFVVDLAPRRDRGLAGGEGGDRLARRVRDLADGGVDHPRLEGLRLLD